MTQNVNPTWHCLVFAHRTFGVTNDPKNPPIASFEVIAPNAFELPPAVSSDGRTFVNENIGGFGVSDIAYYELRPVAVTLKPT